MSASSASSLDLVLRNYTPGDIQAITAIYAHYVHNSVISFDIEAPDEAHMKQKFQAIFRARRPITIATLDDKLIGYAYASSYRTRPAYRFTCENAVYLDPRFMGQGIGSALLEDIIKKSQEYGYNQMIAIITKGVGEYAKSTQGSIALHKKFGFKLLGEFPELGYKFNKWHSIIHMQRKL